MQAADSAAAVVAAGAAGIAVVAARRTIPLRVRAGVGGVAGARDGVPGVCHALAAGGRVGDGGTWRGRRAAP